MRQELEGYRTPPNQGIPLATAPPRLRQEQTRINGSPVEEMHSSEADESVIYIDNSRSNSPSPGVSTRSSLSLDHSGMMAITEWESIEETVGEAHQALAPPPNVRPESIVEDSPSSDSEHPSSEVEITSPTSRLFPPTNFSLERRIPALFSLPTLRVGALRNRLALRRQNAFARPRRVDTPRQARYIPLERPTQGPENNDGSPQVLSRPRRVDAPQQASHQAEEEVDEGIVDTTIDLTDSPPAPAPDQSYAAESPASVLAILRCPVCLDSLAAARAKGYRVLATTCGHIFCSNCLPRCVAANSQCPTCRARLPGPSNYHNLYIE